MKKITILFTLLAFTFGFAQNGGDDCASAVAVVVGPVSGTTITAGPSMSEMGGTGRDSAFFIYTATGDGYLDVNSCLGGADTNLYVSNADETCGSLTVLDSNDDACEISPGGNAYASQVTGVPVLNGSSYIIEWDDLWSLGPFDWSITFTPAPQCVSPTDLTAGTITDTTFDFSWDVPPFGTPVNYDWEVVPTGNPQGLGVVTSGSEVHPDTSAAATGLTASTTYDIFIRTDCGVDGTAPYEGPFTFTTLGGPPPANDVCSGAISIIQEVNIVDAGSATPTAGTVLNAGNTTVPAETCNGFTGNANDDVWYSFEALTANVTITFDLNFDGVATLYEGTCGSLTFLACADDTILTVPIVEEISATTLTPGTTYYVRIYNFGTTPPGNPAFDIKVWTSDDVLGLEDETLNSFKYFPNPVTDKLSLRAQDNIQNVGVYNMLGQEIMNLSPDTNSSEVDMSELSQGAYFVRVSINNSTQTIRILKK